ncbi:MAG TPA: toll/interleukin-1 receptor domain-containing protein, partial [Candidatus Dormibacteraeota bacterium]|nr:toll/interleukin-1 receptor domain-containing protein [Candidatus Dormibacteraeota bacterium]
MHDLLEAETLGVERDRGIDVVHDVPDADGGHAQTVLHQSNCLSTSERLCCCVPWRGDATCGSGRAVARVFVSHASEDRELASELRGWLIEEGHEVFLDQHLRDGIGLGEEWEQRLYERLRWADAVLCTVTSAFVASSWCMAEIAIARSQGSRLLPVQVEPGVQHPLLRSVQHANYSRDKRRAQHQVRTALRRLDSAGRRGWSDEDIPFPGLLPVTLHQAFFGRKVQVEQLAELLRTFATRGERRLVLVVGPSGCGKSSLVRAGLKPIMAAEDDWHVIPTFVPGRDPAQALVREFAAASQELHLGWTLDHVREQLGRKDGIVALADGLLLAAHRRHLLLTVDQFEEVLTQADRESWAHFAAMLAEAQRGPIQAVATLRPESLPELLESQPEARLPLHEVYTLRPLGRERLKEVIVGPAGLAGIEFEDGLVDRMIDDTGSGDALPLLAFALAELARGVTRGGTLSMRRYEELGGVRGALEQQADAALKKACAVSGRT